MGIGSEFVDMDIGMSTVMGIGSELVDIDIGMNTVMGIGSEFAIVGADSADMGMGMSVEKGIDSEIGVVGTDGSGMSVLKVAGSECASMIGLHKVVDATGYFSMVVISIFITSCFQTFPS
jgi:hypothetical protein